MKVKDVAEALGCTEQAVRYMLRQGVPWGTAYQANGNRWTYVIFEERFKKHYSISEK